MAGLRVLVTRPRGQAAGLVRRLKALGAGVLRAPAIRIAPPSSWGPLDNALRRLSSYDAVVFTSANGVERFFARARRMTGRLPRPRRLYAIGPATARALHRRGWRAAALPEAYEAGRLARAMGRVRGLKVLLPRAAVARDLLPRALRRAGASVEVVEAYRTLPDPAGRRRLRRAAGGPIDAATFTSPSTVSAVAAALGAAGTRRFLRDCVPVSIGPVTSRALRRAGATRVVQASTFTSEGLVEALVKLAGSRLRARNSPRTEPRHAPVPKARP